jgi:hypothetical protein
MVGAADSSPAGEDSGWLSTVGIQCGQLFGGREASMIVVGRYSLMVGSECGSLLASISRYLF